MKPVYITKYALTKGIIKITPIETYSDGCAKVHIKGHPWPNFYCMSECSMDQSKALIQAEAMRTKRIAALKKQIEKLENLEIKIVEQ